MVLCDTSFEVSVRRQRQKQLCRRPHLSLKLLQKRNNAIGRLPIVASVQTQQEKMLHIISVKTSCAQLLEKFLPSDHVLVKERSLEARLFENLTQDCWESVYEIILHVETGRTESPGSFGAPLKARLTKNSSSRLAFGEKEINREKPIFVGVFLHKLKITHILMPRRKRTQLIQNKVDPLQIPPLCTREDKNTVFLAFENPPCGCARDRSSGCCVYQNS